MSNKANSAMTIEVPQTFKTIFSCLDESHEKCSVIE